MEENFWVSFQRKFYKTTPRKLNLNNEMSVLAFSQCPCLPGPESGIWRRIYLKGEKGADIKTHIISKNQNFPHQDSLSNITMFNDLQKII
jgi:hypothetical protein